VQNFGSWNFMLTNEESPISRSRGEAVITGPFPQEDILYPLLQRYGPHGIPNQQKI